MEPDYHGSRLTKVTIFAESGALAGDLAACLAGRFEVRQVTSPAAALATLTAGCRALLIVGVTLAGQRAAEVNLIRQALAARCRILVLGNGGLSLEPGLERRVIRLPSLPSPQQIFARLRGLESGPEPGLQAEG